LSSDAKLWCPDIYHGLNVERYGDDRIKYGPCCNSTRQLTDIDSFDFATDPFLQKLRNEFDQGHRPQECNRCWNKEDRGQTSRRMDMIQFYKDAGVQPESTGIKSIDYYTSWACNLACVMCEPYFSSTWARELDLSRDQLYNLGRLYHNNNSVLSQLDVSGVEKLHFNGGEPFLNNDHLELLEKIKQQGDLSKVTISYNSNGTIAPTPQLIDLWKQSKLVRIYFSIDGIKEVFEYIRWPGKWNQTCENILEMKQSLPSNVCFGFNVAVGINLLDLADIFEWFNTNLATNREGDVSNFTWQPMFIKNISVIDSMPTELKQQAIKDLKSIELAKSIVSYIEQSPEGHNSDPWTEWLTELDKKRNSNWRQTLSIGKYYQ
jgi:wyosine [tRNA(Phe)-imidazoG37] synthetase (radical SAM superfamily)